VQQILDEMNAQNAAKKQQQQTLSDVKQQIDSAAKQLGLGGQVQTKQRNDGLEVTVLTDRVLFDSGQDNIKPEGDQLLKLIGDVLAKIDNPIKIEGFTDDQPIGTDRFPNNYALASGRAVAVMEFFAGLGIDPNRLTPESYGPRNPIATNATPDGRAKNRRVEILVVSKAVQKTLNDAGINDQAASPAPPSSGGVAPPTGGPAPNLSPGLGAQ
jgi:chemotaxis protein MotB